MDNVMDMSLDVYSQAGRKLRNIVEKKGTGILMSTVELEEELRNEGCDEKVLLQMILFAKTGNINRYISQTSTGLSMIDVNNIIAFSERETGFDRDTVNQLTSVFLYGLSIPTNLERVLIPKGENFLAKDVPFVPYEEYKKYVRLIEDSINTENEEMFKDLAPAFNKMVESGYSEALYLKGYCYYTGFGTAMDVEAAKKYLKVASYGGSVKAQALLGDIYYENSRYTNAQKCYSVLGAIALSETRQENYKVILEENNLNKKMLTMNMLLMIMIMIFDIMLGKGVFSANGVTHWFWAVVSMLFTLCGYGLAVFQFWKKKYDSIRWVVLLMYSVAFVCAFFAL